MGVGKRVALDLDDLPMDVFELADQGLMVESLTAGHGTTEMAGSCPCSCTCPCSCCCGVTDPQRASDSNDHV
jgi:hypothetical protein